MYKLEEVGSVAPFLFNTMERILNCLFLVSPAEETLAVEDLAMGQGSLCVSVTYLTFVGSLGMGPALLLCMCAFSKFDSLKMSCLPWRIQESFDNK